MKSYRTIDMTSLLTVPSVIQWEEAGASLAIALGKYLELCNSLGTSSLGEGAHPDDLVKRIDFKLESMHSVMDQQLAQARSTLFKTRNEITSPVHRLPDEILVDIFTHVVYSPPNACDHDGVAEMGDHLHQIYRCVYALLGVCSRWQKVIKNRRTFWSIIPVLQAPQSVDFESWEIYEKYRQAMLISLERARGCFLDIAAVLVPGFSSECFDLLKGHLPRIRTINVIASGPDDINCVMDVILQGSSLPSSLSELSIYQTQVEHYRVPEERDAIYSPESPDLVRFNELLRSLAVLRINGAHIHWETLAFSHRLTKLRLQAINLGTDHAMVTRLRHTLASATGLRELEIVSVRSFRSSNSGIQTFFTGPFVPNNLESLVLDDLCINTLIHLLSLSYIPSRPHRLILHLTPNARFFNLTERTREFNEFISILQPVLSKRAVHTLCIHRGIELTAKLLASLIESVPKLHTLLLDQRVLTTEHCNALKRPETENEPHSSSYPSFKCLRFSQVTIEDIVAFRNMVASHSHSMEQLILGGHIQTLSLWGLEDYCTGDDRDTDREIISLFENIVPDFRLTGSEYVPLEYQHDVWQLW
ncbi:unnamed protein product [Rhizoctonia solani]|uniref:F-box domain-containing protein n=1 Tax=Rhizoctonia solani TaxID=456999 RepID=A0A8H3A5I7_9AGAM|nr:unnamed protein product [Rhizoctonia solani]CAE6397932.1 unnamed protein product [Rhizoctonia solani]